MRHVLMRFGRTEAWKRRSWIEEFLDGTLAPEEAIKGGPGDPKAFCGLETVTFGGPKSLRDRLGRESDVP